MNTIKGTELSPEKGKICYKCKEFKKYSEYYKHIISPDGYRYKCKKCIQEYRRTPKIKIARDKAQKRWIVRNPEKYKAQYTLRNYIQRKKIKKQNKCSFCGKEHCIIEGHHEDYSKPLDVIWCCSQCHTDIHRGLI